MSTQLYVRRKTGKMSSLHKQLGKQLMNGKVQNGTTSEERIFNPNLHISKASAQQVLKGKRLKMIPVSKTD